MPSARRPLSLSSELAADLRLGSATVGAPDVVIACSLQTVNLGGQTLQRFAITFDQAGGRAPRPGRWCRRGARDPDDPEPFDRYQAEALVHDHLPTEAILGLACYTSSVKSDLDATLVDLGVELPTAVRPDWYF